MKEVSSFRGLKKKTTKKNKKTVCLFPVVLLYK